MFFFIKDIIQNLFSRKMRRLPWDFNSAFYQYLYNDVNGSGKKPRLHYRKIGKKEGRLYKATSFLKKTSLEKHRDTIVFCCDDERQNLFFIEAIKQLSNSFNIVIIANSYKSSEEYLAYCQWLIINKTCDRTQGFANKLIQLITKLPNLKFVVSNIYESGFLYKQLATKKIASVLVVGDETAFSKSDLSRGLRNATRVVYTNETGALKALYDNMYGYPDQLTILNAATQHVSFGVNESDVKSVIGFGNITFGDGFDIFTQTANLYKKQYPDEKIEFIWIHALNIDDFSSAFVQNQNWQQICQANPSLRIITTPNIIEDYYKNATIFFDTSRFSNKISHIRAAFQAGKAVFGLQDTMPLSLLYEKSGLASQYLFEPYDLYKCVEALHKYMATSYTSTESQFLSLAPEIANVNEFVASLLKIGQEAESQIKHEELDAIELLATQEFDPKYWTGCNNTVLTASAAQQYIRSWKSGVYPRRPCAGFHPGIYAQYHDLGQSRKDPFLHYINKGKPDGPWKWDLLTQQVKITPAALGQKIALQIHAFYIDKLEVMLKALLANELRPDLYISVTNEADKIFAQNFLNDYPAKVEILIAPNRGRDISPLLTLFREQLRHGYDIIGHMHTKTSVHIEDRSYANLWEQYLIFNLLGDGEFNNSADTIIQTMYNDKNINIVYPDDKNAISWVKNRAPALKLAPNFGIEKLPNFINFPVGTMFWATNELMKPFFDLELEWDDYLTEPLPLDGTNLHAIERIFGIINEKISKRLICTMFGNIKR